MLKLKNVYFVGKHLTVLYIYTYFSCMIVIIEYINAHFLLMCLKSIDYVLTFTRTQDFNTIICIMVPCYFLSYKLCLLPWYMYILSLFITITHKG